jgi:TetR/AcrR family transcriptional repressor of nem operon
MATTSDTRKAILDTAARLFHSQSYAEVGIAAICDQAGVSKGSFFHFFPSKRDLALAVMEKFRRDMNDTLITRALSNRHPPLKRLESLVKEIYRYQKAQTEEFGHLPGCPFGNMVMEQSTQDEHLRLSAQGCLRGLANEIRTVVAEAVKSGEIPPVDEEATAEAMLAYLEGVQLLAKAQNDPEVIRRLGPSVTAIRIGRSR